MLKSIETLDDINVGLEALREIDHDLIPIVDSIENIPLRRRAPTLGNLMQIVVSQQVSVASAAAIWARVMEHFNPNNAETIANATIEELQFVGLSRPKIKTLQAISQEVLNTDFNPAALQGLPLEDIRQRLMSIHGVGPWTSEIFALFCLGHPDVFPTGDIALQEAARDIKGLDERPKGDTLAKLAEVWSPWRGVAARLLWAHYAVLKGRGNVIPIS